MWPLYGMKAPNCKYFPFSVVEDNVNAKSFHVSHKSNIVDPGMVQTVFQLSLVLYLAFSEMEAKEPAQSNFQV